MRRQKSEEGMKKRDMKEGQIMRWKINGRGRLRRKKCKRNRWK